MSILKQIGASPEKININQDRFLKYFSNFDFNIKSHFYYFYFYLAFITGKYINLIHKHSQAQLSTTPIKAPLISY